MTATDVRVVSEPLTYAERAPHSFFVDLARSQRQGDPDGWEARDRLTSHRKEMDVELRVNPRTTTGQGGEFSPPLWAIEKFATQARAGRVIADLVPNLFLPAGYSSVNVPLLTTSGAALVQPAQPNAVSQQDEVTGNTQNTTVATISGDGDISQQLFDLTPAPGQDGVIYVDLMRDYNETLEQQLTFGTGANGQLTGLTAATGRQTDVSGAGVSVTQATGVPQLKPLVGQAMAAIGNNRKLPADNLVMAPRRWAWVASDASEIPVTQTWPLPGYPTVGEQQLVPTTPMALSGLPAYQSASCMSGAITATDVLIVFRSADMLLYESVPYFVAMENPLSGTLQMRLQLRKYAAFVHLKPAGIACVTALPAPTAFGA